MSSLIVLIIGIVIGMSVLGVGVLYCKMDGEIDGLDRRIRHLENRYIYKTDYTGERHCNYSVKTEEKEDEAHD